MSKLIEAGRAGAVSTVYGGAPGLLERLSHTEDYTLIVVGDVFLSRGAAVKTRLKRNLLSQLADHLRTPVISSEELKTQYLFGARQWLNLLLSGGLIALIYAMVFSWQPQIMGFLSTTGTAHRMLATVLVVLGVPVAAFIIGGFAHNVCKLAKLE